MSEANEVLIVAVIYMWPRRQSNSSKTFKKIGKKLKQMFIIILRPTKLFKTMNQPDPTRLDQDALSRIISWTVLKIET